MTYCCQYEGKKANRTTTGLSRFTACVSKIVASNAVGLLLLLPQTAKQHNARAVAQAGLPAHVVDGKPAVALAKRMGFEEEYLMWWTWVFPEGVNGNGIPCARGPVGTASCSRFVLMIGKRVRPTHDRPSVRWVITVGAPVGDEQREGGCRMREREQEGMQRAGICEGYRQRSRKEIEGARSSIDEFFKFGCCIPAGVVLVDRLLRVRDATEAFYGLDRHD